MLLLFILIVLCRSNDVGAAEFYHVWPLRITAFVGISPVNGRRTHHH